ncbi:ABC transporter substrate-binding protein [Aestuariivivens insulae]|uniref:ABC transporter substrate-binding protein n=1 Tax=Aestuariivivens insulae TaxID=1621988 RepID=UPI001F566763|nr:helical backbone metal receptor [Aestuariivivens insulae]
MTNPIKDQLQRTLHLNKIPKRIVSLVPSQTELLCDLGLETAVVGVTKFCMHPRDIRKKAAVVGGTKQVHFDKIKALKPDIILCNKEENTKAIVEACESICEVHVSDVNTIVDSLQLMEQYGQIFDCKKETSKLTNEIKNKVEDFKVFIKEKPVLNVAYCIWKNPYMVAANHTFINHMLELNKFKNVFDDLERYPEVNMQDRVADYILLSSEPFPFKEVHKREIQELCPNAKVVLVDGEQFSWYGSRLTKAFAYFKSLRLDLQKGLA